MGRLAFILFAIPLLAQPGPQYAKPDLRLTPGVIDTTIVADLTKAPHLIGGVDHNICAPDFRTPPFRVATKNQKIKTAVCAAYGITSGCPGADWELDDTVAVEIGGKNVQANLWPQPIKEARVKDHQVADALGGPKGLVCQGKITLADAQKCMRTDWAACAARVKSLEGK